MMDPDVSPEAMDLAKEIITKLDAARAERQEWYVAVHDPGVATFLRGPFSTPMSARKAVNSGKVFAASEGAQGMVLPLIR